MITEQELAEIAQEFGYPLSVVLTVRKVFTHPDGFIDGQIRVRFEAGRYYRYCKVIVDVLGDGPTFERDAFRRARNIHSTYAHLSCLWGLGAVPGWDFAELGYTSVEQMVAKITQSESAQFRDWLAWIRLQNKQCDSALKKADWRTFLLYFNGPNAAIAGLEQHLLDVYHHTNSA